MQVEFTKIAKLTLKKNVDFLKILWTDKEVAEFLDDVDNLTRTLKEGKFLMFQEYSKNIRSALIGRKHVRVYFKLQNKNLIKILLYFHTKEAPKKLREYLKNNR